MCKGIHFFYSYSKNATEQWVIHYGYGNAGQKLIYLHAWDFKSNPENSEKDIPLL